jgi:hypothetical protein
MPRAELKPFVMRLTKRIGTFPPEAIALNKLVVDTADHLPIHLGLLEGTHEPAAGTDCRSRQLTRPTAIHSAPAHTALAAFRPSG